MLVAAFSVSIVSGRADQEAKGKEVIEAGNGGAALVEEERVEANGIPAKVEANDIPARVALTEGMEAIEAKERDDHTAAKEATEKRDDMVAHIGTFGIETTFIAFQDILQHQDHITRQNLHQDRQSDQPRGLPLNRILLSQHQSRLIEEA